MDSLLQDLRYALRTLVKSRGFATIAVLVLALGVGINAAIFSIVNAVLFRPLPVSHPEELAYLYFSIGDTDTLGTMASRELEFFRDDSPAFSDVTGHWGMAARLGAFGEMESFRGESVLSNYFDVLGVAPVLGRTLLADEDKPSTAGRAVIISDDLWRRRFRSDRSVIGTDITLNDRVFTIVGVMAPGFKGVSDPWSPTQFWVTAAQWSEEPRFNFSLLPIARLKPGVPFERARAVVATQAEQLRASMLATANARGREAIAKYRYSLWPASDVRLPFDPTGRVIPARLATALMAIVAVVLFIAVANIAGLLLARGVARRCEIAVRLALGAGRSRIVRQLLTETLLLSSCAGALALPLGIWLVQIFLALTPERFGFDVPLDLRVVIFTSIVCLGTGFIVGLAPARQVLNINLLTTLGGSAFGATSSRFQLRHLVVVPQVALLVVLLLASAIYVKDLVNIESARLGYNPDRLVVLSANLTQQRNDTVYRADPQQAERFAQRTRVFYRNLLASIDLLPTAQTVAVTTGLPLRGRVPYSGHPQAISQEAFQNGALTGVVATQRAVSPHFFSTLGMSMLAGRAFDDRDAAPSPRVAIVSEALARRLWPGRNALGRSFAFRNPTETAPKMEWLEVVGVVNEVNPILVDQGQEPAVYLPLSQQWRVDARTLVARVDRDPTAVIDALRKAVAGADLGAQVHQVRTMSQMVGEILYPRRMAAAILTTCALIGFVLASLGLYGVVAFSVAQRVREIGVRTVLGAQRADIMKLITAEGLRIVFIGSLVGFPLALGVRRAVSASVVAVPQVDIVLAAAVAVLLVGVVLAACYVPARRAARVDPMVALREL